MPWNKGKLIGARPPLRPKHVWSIRTRFLVEGRIRDLALAGAFRIVPKAGHLSVDASNNLARLAER